MNHIIPQMRDRLPELMAFLEILAAEYGGGKYEGWRPDFVQRVLGFYTPVMMDKIEHIAPGWKEMSKHAEAQTLIHVTAALISLIALPEYTQATPRQQKLAEWIVLYHDIGKKPSSGKKDNVHGFTSAAITGKALLPAGFIVNEKYSTGIDQWCMFTRKSIKKDGILGFRGDSIQDNVRLPEIMNGITLMFGENAPASAVIKGVLLHMSINVVEDWPQAAPLTPIQIKQFIDAELLTLLEIMMLVDSDAWALFEPDTKVRHRRETKAVFEAIRNAHIGFDTDLSN